jgi:hypothetical protein
LNFLQFGEQRFFQFFGGFAFRADGVEIKQASIDANVAGESGFLRELLLID